MVFLPTPRSPRDGSFQLTPRLPRHVETIVRSDTPPPQPVHELPIEYVVHQRRMLHQSAQQAAEEADRRAAAEAISNREKVRHKSRAARAPRTRAQVVGMAGILSAASDCTDVLKGELEPAVFARRVASMTPEAMEAWLGAFGACVGKLGGTLSGLTEKLQRQRGSEKQQKMMDVAMQVVERVEAFEETMERLREDVPSVVDDARDHVVGALAASSDALCTRPIRNARLWSKALTVALVATERETKRLHTAMESIGLASESLGACADAICTHACALTGCDDACIYVGVHPGTGPPGKEALYRLRAPSPSEEETALCDVQIHGAAAVAVPPKSLAAQCLASRGEHTLHAPDGYMDPKYIAAADRPGGAPFPASLLYVKLSDEGGPLRAVLRVSHHLDGRHPFELGQGDAAVLVQLAPVFCLALRHAARAAAVDPIAAQRARVMDGLGACLASLGDEARAGELGGVMEAFGTQISTRLRAEGCTMYMHDEVNRSLVQLPADTELEPRVVSIAPSASGKDNEKQGGPSGSGLAGLCAVKRVTYNSPEGRADARLKLAADAPFGASPDFAFNSSLCAPIESVASGELLGVCELVNKRDADDEPVPFDDEDEATLYAILRVASLAIENYQLHAANKMSRAGLLARRKSRASHD